LLEVKTDNNLPCALFPVVICVCVHLLLPPITEQTCRPVRRKPDFDPKQARRCPSSSKEEVAKKDRVIVAVILNDN